MMGMLSYALRLIEESLVSKLMEAGCFRYGDEYDGEIDVRLRLRGDNVVSMLMEPRRFRYGG